MTEIVIRMEALTRDFGPMRALNGLSLEVPTGIVFGFLCPNGMGKTTTIRLLLGLLEPIGGRVEVLGFDTCTQAGQVRTRAGALLERACLYEQLSAEDNLELYARVWRMSKAEWSAWIKGLLTHIGLWRATQGVGGGIEPGDEAETGPGPSAAAPAVLVAPGRADGRAGPDGSHCRAQRPGCLDCPRGGDGLSDDAQHDRG